MLFKTQAQVDYANARAENHRSRNNVDLKRYTALFDVSGKPMQRFFFTADHGLESAADIFQRFLNDRLWVEIPTPPNAPLFRCRTSDIRNFKIIEGWLYGVENWPTVQRVNT